MKSYKQLRSQCNEVLKKSDPIDKWISDFVHSNDPKFAGKTKEERIEMAKGAYYGAQKESIDEGENKQMKGKDPCWKGYQMVGTKKKNGREVPNCVPEEIEEDEYSKYDEPTFQRKNPKPEHKSPGWTGHNMDVPAYKRKAQYELEKKRLNKEAVMNLPDKEKNKMLSNKDKGTLGKIANLMAKQKKINELNKSTLKSYADKAHQASQDHAYDAEHQYNDKKAQEKSRQMAAKRAAGVAKADAKLAKEEVEINEQTVWHNAAKEVKTIKDKMMQKQLDDLAKTLEQIGKAPNSLANLMGNNLMNKLNLQLQRLDTDVRDGVIQKFQKVGLMKESTAHKIIATKLANMDRMKNVRIPTPAERRAEIEKRTAGAAKATDKLSKEEVMLNFEDFLKEAKSCKKETVKHPNQKVLDVDGDGKIEADDLKKLRDTKKEGFVSHAQRKAVWASKNEKKEAYESCDYDEKEEMDETLTPKLVKQGIGIARDKRYAGGNMTGATKAMDKLHPKLSSHPRVASELKKQNEEVEFDIEESTPISYNNFKSMLEAYTVADKLADLKAKREMDPNYAYSKHYEKHVANKPKSTSTKHVGTYGKHYDGDDEDDNKQPETKEKRGRGRPSGSKSGARQKGTGRSDGGIAVHNLNLPKFNNKF